MAKTLLIPLVSTGNVPQLAIDLVLHSLSSEFQFVASLDATYTHPFIGPLDYVLEQEMPVLFQNSPQKRYSTALELFFNEKKSIYVLQQRTPIIQGYINNFIKEVIVPLVAQHDITEVVIMDSFGVLDDDVVSTAAVGLRSTSRNFSDAVCEVDSVGEMVQEFERSLQLDGQSNHKMLTSLFKFSAESIQQELSMDQQVFNFAYHLVNAPTTKLKRIRYCNLFVHEGDNSEDAYLFCEYLPKVVESLERIEEPTPPISWKGVYGSRPVATSFDEGIYI